MRFLSYIVASLAVVGTSIDNGVLCDLRMASHPDQTWDTKSRGPVKFINPTSLYMEPSAFDFAGLANQRKHAYDNFLRSNIDNEHNRRNFATEPGRDMLPFRSYEGGFQDTAPFAATNTVGAATVLTKTPTVAAAGATDILNKMPTSGTLTGPFSTTPAAAITVNTNTPFTVPLRWNNPHSSELEVNIWIRTTATPTDGTTPGVAVVPIKKPACAGEGHQDNVIAFTIPNDFYQLPTTVPGFKGCLAPGDCTLQVYAHSVESRQYAIGTPIVVPETATMKYSATTTGSGSISAAPADVGTNVAALKMDICLPSNDPAANVVKASAQFPRLISDEFTHAYMNSGPYSPYSGQQPLDISRNLQYSCLNRMITGNRGELGKSTMTTQQAQALKNAETKEANLVKAMEGIVNKIIDNLLSKVNAPTPAAGASDGTTGLKTAVATLKGTANPSAATGAVSAKDQATASCFRCSQVGSTTTTRLNTNTYVPSFNIPPTATDAAGKNLLTQAAALSTKYPQLVDTTTGNVLIYKTVYNLMANDYANLANMGLYYQTAALKPAMTTLVAALPDTKPADPQFLKYNPLTKKRDNGQYAANVAYAWLKTSSVAALAIPGTQWNKPTPKPASVDFDVMAADQGTGQCYDVANDPTAQVPYEPDVCAAQNAKNAPDIECSCDGMDPGGVSNDGACDKLENSPGDIDQPCQLGSQGMIQMFCSAGTSAPCPAGTDPDDGGALTVKGAQLVAGNTNAGDANSIVVNGNFMMMMMIATVMALFYRN